MQGESSAGYPAPRINGRVLMVCFKRFDLIDGRKGVIYQQKLEPNQPSWSKLAMSSIQGSPFYYLVLLLGMGFLGVYFWIILTASIANIVVYLILLMSAFVATTSTMGLAASKSRSGRLGLTMLSGFVGGIHGYLDIVLFPIGLYGAFLFFWWAIGLMMAFAALAWIIE